MTENKTKNELFVAGSRAETGALEGKRVSVSALRRSTKKRLAIIRETYEKASLGSLAPTKNHSAREWLCDNYYLIDREGKAAVEGMKRLAPLPAAADGMPVIYGVAVRLCETAGAVGPEEAESYLAGVSEKYVLSNAELFAFRNLLTAAVIALVASECKAVAGADGGSGEVLAGGIGTLRAMSGADMSECFEKLSAVERLLCEDPSGVYCRMSDDTKAYYRECVSAGARKSGVCEADFVAAALAKAHRGENAREKHVGTYIVPEPGAGPGRLFLAIYYITPFLIAAATWLLTRSVPFSILMPIPLWTLRNAFQENVASALSKKRFVCSLDPDKLSEDVRTTVVISCLITSADQIKKLVKNLLQVRLSGRGIRCGLLADFKESATASRPEDEHLLSVLEKEIAHLNADFGGGCFAIVRKRSFSACDGKYMGRERKRGAISDFIRYINTGVCDFASLTGDLRGVVGSDYLLTLDADTTLSINAVAELTAVSEHPLNKAVVDGGRVVNGFGIVVPRLTTDIESSSRSAFSRLFAGGGGLHSYGGPSGDLYQDLFGRGVFTGKGLIDVKAFSAVADGAFPENRILSHDVVEGGILHVCVAAATEVSDSYPTTVKSWLIRQARWVRGDFQNAFFLIGKGKKAKGGKANNHFRAFDRYKLFDNVRRAATPMFTLAALGFCVFSESEYRPLFLALLFASVSAGEFVAAIRVLFKPRIAFRRYITRGIPAFFACCARMAVGFLLLPQTAAISFCEMLKALWRTLVSHKNMLEWLTAAEAESGKRNGMKDYYLYFRFTAVLGVASAFGGRLPLAVAGVLWALAPALLCELSRPAGNVRRIISEDDEEFLYSSAAAMWRFFDRYVTEETRFLPPDNVQYSPYRVAMRTSPTNIGLYLLCALAARDFGFIDSRELCERVSGTLSTVAAVPKWHGNLYNWYDLKTLETLKPEYVSTVDSGNLLCCLTALKEGLKEYSWECAGIEQLVAECERLLSEADISVLYNARRRLFYIGWDAASGGFGANMYDMLMSEARMTSYYAVAKKVADKRHWGTLGRLFAGTDGYVGPVSWTGTMFEHFMPHLLLPVVGDSLTDEALRYALYCQKKRTASLRLPWGVSESGYYSFDMSMDYRYKAFGVQKLGLKRGLDDELVISPYSSFLTLSFAPDESVANLKRLVNMGMNGEFGLYEAIDFTASRTGGGFAIVKSYMAHHVGMSLVSAVNCLFGDVMQKRFMRDADMRTAQKLLEEAVYEGVSLYKGAKSGDVRCRPRRQQEEGVPLGEADPGRPRALLLSNGELSTVITDGGSGFSLWNGLDLTAHKRDLLLTPSGVYVLLKEDRGETFSITADPLRDGVAHKAEFSSSGAVFTAAREGLEAAMSVAVHGRIPAEIRVIKVGNTEKRKKEAKLLIYAEPVLCSGRDHAAHPAFSDLFVMCEYREAEKCLLVWRRGDVEEEACVAFGFSDPKIDFVFESDRSEVLKKGEGIFSLPEAFGTEFSCSGGTPVIPCAALKTRLTLRGGERVKLTFIQCAGRNREEALSRFSLIRKQGERGLIRSSWEAGSMAVSANEERVLSDVLPRVFFNAPRQPRTEEACGKNVLGRKDLWSLSVSGDYPIVTCLVSSETETSRAAAHIGAQGIAASGGAVYDLCIVYRDMGDYCGRIRSELEELISRADGRHLFLVNADNVGRERVDLLMAASVFCDDGARAGAPDKKSRPPFTVKRAEPLVGAERIESFVPGGGFEKEAFVAYPQKCGSPLPWCFPMANMSFGTLVSDSSLGFSFYLNSRLNQLTRWSNDYMTDNVGERLFCRIGEEYFDMIRGACVRFGRGFAEYCGKARGLEWRVKVGVHEKMPVKIYAATLRNVSEKRVRAELAFYSEPLPDVAAQSFLKLKVRGGMLLAENPYNDDYKGVAACLSCSEKAGFVTGKESFFAGEWGAAVSVGEPPCAAAVTTIELGAGEAAGPAFYLSMARGARAAAYPHERFKACPAEAEKLSRGCGNAIRISTPDEDLDRLVNFYLPYQVKVSRVMSRTGFSQNSGAFGFRDQLQDVCALLLSDPDTARNHILKAASAQFEEGDVLHWWHKLPKDAGGFKGVRTRCSDDLLWLPYAVAEYVLTTEDIGILSKNVNFIHGDNLLFYENEKYISPVIAGNGSVYEHCKRAIERGYRVGDRGLLLFGSGDWNDGMNRVGVKGKGESVWLSMFAVTVMDKFAEISDRAGDKGYANALRGRCASLKASLEKCWDNDRYIRGYHDDGSKLGARGCAECEIDSLPQSFSVFSGLDPKRARLAVKTAIEKLVVKERNLVKIFAPPFKTDKRDVGYIKRYPAGIRENGGQYTHAAVWLARAAFRTGLADEGAEIMKMISPLTHSYDAGYKVEPYFIAADIYSAKPREGRGGWTIYTGAAAWYYRVVIEDILGIKKRGKKLFISPSVPSGWDGFEVEAELEGTVVKIKAERTGERRLRVNGKDSEAVLLNGGEATVEIEY